MKLTKSKLKQIIKEELNKYLHEGAESMPKYGTMPCRALKEHAKHYPEAKKEFERRLKTDCAHLAPKKESKGQEDFSQIPRRKSPVGSSPAKKEAAAHEAAHVVQQRKGR